MKDEKKFTMPPPDPRYGDCTKYSVVTNGKPLREIMKSAYEANKSIYPRDVLRALKKLC